jgi:hypothetical protein
MQTDKDDALDAVIGAIAMLSGSTPLEVTPRGDGAYDFRIETNRMALDVFPHEDEEPMWLLVKTEINGDEKGWYEEAMLFSQQPTADRDGYLIEGIYGREIEYRLHPKGEFEGTFHPVREEDDWERAEAQTQMRYDVRTSESLLDSIEMEFRMLSKLTSGMTADGEGGRTRARYRALLQDCLRLHLGGGSSGPAR